ncbi:anti-sigma factor [Halobacillus shinanisalinarum]|uniref:Anti-sigma factor n=1 Tax=Halobacillus shinanisalinarum TaxID=2932258 RepID=A0ABY4GXI1_9BACI|nr:anti sigma factor C-terminal domain-containing protein [Halobacillus shinanisalinarum]UOQ92890.1 anti-sigma factor [Halobacillus shinanisalinarum]
MSDHDKNRETEANKEELDFVSSPSLQKAVKKAKWKQTIKFFVIGSLSTIIILYALFCGGQYLLQKRIGDHDKVLFSHINGANVFLNGGRYVYGFMNLSVVKHSTVKKHIGDREIIWNRKEIEIPIFGQKGVVNSGRFTEVISFSERFNRRVHYNNFNGEREVDFYYPQLEYDYLPNELEIATSLDENTLAEVALSFDQPYTLKELEDKMGSEHVNWIWVLTTTEKEFEKLSEPDQHYRPYTTLDGPSADGFQVHGDLTSGAKRFLEIVQRLSEEGSYQSAAKEIANGINQESFPNSDDIRVTGAVVSGTPEELEGFQDLEIVRASTIGATTDLY